MAFPTINQMPYHTAKTGAPGGPFSQGYLISEQSQTRDLRKIPQKPAGGLIPCMSLYNNWLILSMLPYTVYSEKYPHPSTTPPHHKNRASRGALFR